VLVSRMYGSVKNNNSIIIDQTNLDPVVRASKLAMIPAHYHKKAIVFDVDIETLLERQRAPERLSIGKFIPDAVFANMQAVYRKPDLSEFNEIVTIARM
jgi:predicted kinase